MSTTIEGKAAEAPLPSALPRDRPLWIRVRIECVGSSIGLMAMMVAVGAMSVTWMAVIAVVVIGQKLVGARAVIDVALALAIVGLGIVILAAPSWIPGLTPVM
jgi:Predicted metal-binding integral membrane protein (DUF2182)